VDLGYLAYFRENRRKGGNLAITADSYDAMRIINWIFKRFRLWHGLFRVVAIISSSDRAPAVCAEPAQTPQVCILLINIYATVHRANSVLC
jgi:hypothetical protein